MNELEVYFENQEKLPSKSSLSAYRSQFKKIKKDIKEDLTEVSVETIMEYLETIPIKNTKKNLLNIFVMLKRKNHKEDYDFLITLRETYKNEIDIALQEKNTELELKLPEFADIEKHLRDSNGVDYIVNYILFYFQTRAKDIDLIIYKNLPENEDEGNYITISEDGKTAMYMRNDYKTVATHGSKFHTIKDKKFIATILALLGRKEQVKLLNLKQADKAVRNSTYNGISEAEHVKILVHHYFGLKNINKLIKISESRGTNLNLIMRNYNLSYKTPLFKEEESE